MSFEDELRPKVLRAKANHPGFDHAIDKIVEDFHSRRDKGEFEKWTLDMIVDEFHTAVRR